MIEKYVIALFSQTIQEIQSDIYKNQNIETPLCGRQ